MRNIIWLLMIGTALVIGATAQAGETPAPDGAMVYIISPVNGAKLASPVNVLFGMRGMGVAPAGVEKENTGHHHLLIDTPLPTGEALNEAITKDAQHLHFGGGETEATVELTPGKHTLQLLLGDHNHIPHKTPIASAAVTIVVE